MKYKKAGAKAKRKNTKARKARRATPRRRRTRASEANARPTVVAPAEAPSPAPARKGAHPPHPKCPGCGRALYKSMEPKAVKKSDPWGWCRFEGCKFHGRDQSKLGAAGRFAVKEGAR